MRYAYLRWSIVAIAERRWLKRLKNEGKLVRKLYKIEAEKGGRLQWKALEAKSFFEEPLLCA